MRLGEGDCFGEIAIITGMPRTASAIAHTNCIVLGLRREKLQGLMNEYQNLRYIITSAVEQRMQETKKVDQQVVRRLTVSSRLTKDFHRIKTCNKLRQTT